MNPPVFDGELYCFTNERTIGQKYISFIFPYSIIEIGVIMISKFKHPFLIILDCQRFVYSCIQ